MRVLRFRGTPVEVQNYIDDTGVQVADIIVGFRELEHRDARRRPRRSPTRRGSTTTAGTCTRASPSGTSEDARASQVRARALHDLEHGGNDTAAMGAFIVDRIVRAHLATMARLNIGYDLLTYEGDILRLQFWAHAFDILKAQGAVFLQTEGKLAGCWVMRIEEGGRQPSAEAEPPNRRRRSREKVIVRSNGVVTYVGKDIANQFWKFGLLGRDFRYRLFATCRPTGRRCGRRRRGDGESGRAAVRPRRAHLQRHRLAADVSAGAAQPGAADARPPARSRELDPLLVRDGRAVARDRARARLRDRADSEEARKPFVEVSGRKGLGVKIDDLLDLLTEKATAEVAKRNPELSDDECAAAWPRRSPSPPSATSC